MTTITLEMLRKQFVAARSRSALIPGLADMLTALEAHLVIEAEHHRRLEETVRELAVGLTAIEGQFTLHLQSAAGAKHPHAIPAELADLRARIDAVEPGDLHQDKK